jgi:hypothetical protein
VTVNLIICESENICDAYDLEHLSCTICSRKNGTLTAGLTVSSSYTGYVKLHPLVQPQFKKADGNLY